LPQGLACGATAAPRFYPDDRSPANRSWDASKAKVTKSNRCSRWCATCS
jgi:hypothetical protein